MAVPAAAFEELKKEVQKQGEALQKLGDFVKNLVEVITEQGQDIIALQKKKASSKKKSSAKS